MWVLNTGPLLVLLNALLNLKRMLFLKQIKVNFEEKTQINVLCFVVVVILRLSNHKIKNWLLCTDLQMFIPGDCVHL